MSTLILAESVEVPSNVFWTLLLLRYGDDRLQYAVSVDSCLGIESPRLLLPPIGAWELADNSTDFPWFERTLRDLCDRGLAGSVGSKTQDGCLVLNVAGPDDLANLLLELRSRALALDPATLFSGRSGWLVARVFEGMLSGQEGEASALNVAWYCDFIDEYVRIRQRGELFMRFAAENHLEYVAERLNDAECERIQVYSAARMRQPELPPLQTPTTSAILEIDGVLKYARRADIGLLLATLEPSLAESAAALLRSGGGVA